MTHPHPQPQRLLRAYVDETGDRGQTANSSTIFAMAGIVIADEDEHLMIAAVDKIRALLSVPANKPLHWNEHVRSRIDRRKLVARELGTVPLALNYVVFHKASMPATALLRSDQEVFYNFTAALMMERLLLAAKYWPGGSRRLTARFGHVKGFRHQETLNYFNLRRQRDAWVPWNLATGPAQFVSAGSYRGHEAADQFAGMLKAALCPDAFGDFDPLHLLAVRHLIRRRADGSAWGHGFKVMANPGTMESYPWWPAGGI